MPKTVLSLTVEERSQIALLRTSFVELPFFEGIDKRLFERARQEFNSRLNPVYRFNKDIRARFCSVMRSHLQTQPCTVLEAMQSEDAYTRLTGREQAHWSSNRDVIEDCWWRCYKPLFDAWQADHGLEVFTSWDQAPSRMAGYYHLQEYGAQDLRSRQFDDPMALALFYDVLHEVNVTTLAQLAALSVNDLYPLIQRCGYSQEDETLRLVRAFLRRHHLDIHTVIANIPLT